MPTITSPEKRGSLVSALERYFLFEALETNWRTEILAGFTTFMTMAYIVFVNPSILHEAGMPIAAVTAATCCCAALGSILMGALANYPIALAPGMGLNAYFTYTVVKHMGVPWQTALGAVFISGVIFLLLTFGGIRQLLVSAIPHELHAAVAGGVGLFIAFIGLRNAGLIVSDPATIVALGNLHNPQTSMAVFGLLLIALLQVFRVRASMLIGILGTALAGWAFGLVHWQPQSYRLSDITATALKLDIRSALHIGAFEIIFVFLFVDLFDNIGTLVAVSQKAGLIDAQHRIARLNRIFFADATATIAGSLAGTSTVTSYIESSAGVAAGGRSGVTAIVTGLLFVAALFVAPLVGAIPTAATSPALIIVGGMMLSPISEIRWSDPLVAFPAFLTLVTIPLTYSIANGLSFGIIAFALLHILSGRFHWRDWLLYVLAALFLLRFFYLAQG